MHASRYFVHVNDELMTRELSPETSEWLFATGFWREINSRLGTLFDQFEEEEVTGNNLAALISALKEKVYSLSKENASIEFVRGWDQGYRELTVQLNRDSAIHELNELITVIEDAHKNGKAVRFEL